MATAQASGRHCLIFLLLPKRFVLSTLKNKGEYQKQIIKVIRVRCKSYRSTIKMSYQHYKVYIPSLGVYIASLGMYIPSLEI
jgi:hypothetical protein